LIAAFLIIFARINLALSVQIRMFKQITAIIFFAALLSQSMCRVMILADYSLNKTYIANVLCENKDNPTMHCNGKCYLSKKLQEAEKQQSPANQKTLPEIQLFIATGNTELSSRVGTLISCAYGRYHKQLTSIYHRNIFRPPVI
jgi:hypothetical protein